MRTRFHRAPKFLCFGGITVSHECVFNTSGISPSAHISRGEFSALHATVTNKHSKPRKHCAGSIRSWRRSHEGQFAEYGARALVFEAASNFAKVSVDGLRWVLTSRESFKFCQTGPGGG